MAVRGLRLVTLLVFALTLALSFCHLMEMPARLDWSRELWVEATVEGNQFRLFGSVGAVLEVASLVLALALAALVWRRGGAARWLTLGAFLLFAAAMGYWWLQVFPANRAFAGWTGGPIPPTWEALRRQWEYGHAVRAVLHIAGFLVLGWSILRETPAR